MPRVKNSDTDLVLDRLMAQLRQVEPGDIIQKATYRGLATDYRGRYRGDLVRKAVRMLRRERVVFKTVPRVGLLHIGTAREHFLPLQKDYQSIKNKMASASERLDAAPLDQFANPVDSQMRWSQSMRLKTIGNEADTGLHETKRYMKANPDPADMARPRDLPSEPQSRVGVSNPTDIWPHKGE